MGEIAWIVLNDDNSCSITLREGENEVSMNGTYTFNASTNQGVITIGEGNEAESTPFKVYFLANFICYHLINYSIEKRTSC